MIPTKRLQSSLVFDNAVSPVISLGMHSFADSFLEEQMLGTSEPVFPLNVLLDASTGLIHNEYLIDSKSRYNWVDYSYTSSNSSQSRQHFQELSQSLYSQVKMGAKILEIGANDGYLLNSLKAQGVSTFAIDASKAMVAGLKSMGIEAKLGRFGEDPIDNFFDSELRFDLIIANNVLNHSSNPLQFLRDIDLLLNFDGVAIIEVPYWLRQIEKYRFDMIYHEHVSYFTVKAFKSLLKETSLLILEIEEVTSHGGSLRITLGKSGRESNEIQGLIDKEVAKLAA